MVVFTDRLQLGHVNVKSFESKKVLIGFLTSHGLPPSLRRDLHRIRRAGQ
jgi:hypothetical protein